MYGTFSGKVIESCQVKVEFSYRLIGFVNGNSLFDWVYDNFTFAFLVQNW